MGELERDERWTADRVQLSLRPHGMMRIVQIGASIVGVLAGVSVFGLISMTAVAA